MYYVAKYRKYQVLKPSYALRYKRSYAVSKAQRYAAARSIAAAPLLRRPLAAPLITPKKQTYLTKPKIYPITRKPPTGLRIARRLDDQRRYYPGIRPYHTVTGSPVAYKLVDTKGAPKLHQQTKARLAFKNAGRVIICIERKKRRETLFRRRKIGKGIQVSPKRRYTDRTEIICR